VALGSRNRGHVPHRSSRLTSVLRESLGGNCKTVNIYTYIYICIYIYIYHAPGDGDQRVADVFRASAAYTPSGIPPGLNVPENRDQGFGLNGSVKNDCRGY